MAEALIERWRLAVLRVRLDVSGRTPLVTAELGGFPGGVAHTVWRREYPPEAFGLLSGTTAPTSLSLPDDLRMAVARSLDEDFGREAALWLRLVPPHGYLGAVPWEEALVGETGLPVVRVPDRLPAAADPGHVWRIAIAINAPPGSTWATPYITAFLSALRGAVRAKIDAHVFSDAATHEDLKAQLRQVAQDPDVHVHDPGRAKQAHDERSDRSIPELLKQRRSIRLQSSSPPPGVLWADWITAGLAGAAVRALHVVADGTFDGDRSMLAVSPDPHLPADRSSCAYVQPDDVRYLADVVGAAALSFGSPPDNPSDVATRVIADTVGLRRPGATLYSSLRLDPAGYALAQAYAFIASNEPGEVPIPRHPSLFAYLQPELVQGALREPWPSTEATDLSFGGASEETLLPGLESSPSALPPQEDLSAYYAQADVVPAWLASSERFIDTQLARMTTDPTAEREASSTRQAYEDGTAEALAELRALVAKHVRPQ